MHTPLTLISDYKNVEYTEIRQEYPCKFAFGMIEGNTVVVRHKPVLCRDFLLDTLIWVSGEADLPRHAEYNEDTGDWEYTGEPGDIYGYNFTGPIDTEAATLVVYKLNNARENWDFFNKWVVNCGMQPSELIPTDQGYTYVIRGDKEWMKTTAMFSMYTWAIRNFLYPEKPNVRVEHAYGGYSKPRTIEDVYPKIVALPRTQVALIPDIKEYDDGEEYHSLNGFLTYLDNQGLTIHAA